MRRLLITTLLLGTTFVAACGCPIGTKPLFVETGSYKVSTAGGDSGAYFPSPDAQGKTLEVDRANDTVKISYTLNGKKYVETWRVAAIKAP